MARFRLFFIFTVVFFTTLLPTLSVSQPEVDSGEQKAVYQVLDSINSDISWRSLFPDDLCFSAPHGIVCDYFVESNDSLIETLHVTELSFGYVSDYSPNPPCSSNASLNPVLFTSFKYLRKLFFYKCFTESPVSFPDISPSFRSSIEELVFIENPALIGSIPGMIRSFTSLRRVIFAGTGVTGEIPDGFGDLINLEEITLSRNRIGGEVPASLTKLKKLKVLDLSHNLFAGKVPESVGLLPELLKMDLSYNGFDGEIPESIKNLQKLEFLDLSYNRFGNYGIPLFLGNMKRLKEVYLSGNLLGGQIPETWENHEGILGIGFSSMGLTGNIPSSIGIKLNNLSYLGLDNNKLEGNIPNEIGHMESVNELNLENNNLSGKIPFSAEIYSKIGRKLKLGGNPFLCLDEKLISVLENGNFQTLKICSKQEIPNPVIFSMESSSRDLILVSYVLMFIGFMFFFAFHWKN